VRVGGFLGAALLVAAGLTLAPATADPAPQKPPAFPTQAEIVTVDVVVLDRDGKPVAGLTRSDFVVREDGRPQAVTAFEAVETMAPALVAPAVASDSPSAARVATNVSAPPTRRTFAIVFDDLHIGDLNVEQARRAVRAFLDRDTRSGDRLMLLTTSDGRYWATARGPGDADFRSALGRVASRRLARDRLALQMSPLEAMRIADTGDVYVEERVRRRRAVLSGLCVWTGTCCECRVGQPGSCGPCIVPPEAPSAEETYSLARRSLQQTLRVVREAARQLGAQRERKTLVLVSEGFMLDPSFDGFRQVREECARSNVVVYFLDARGLAAGPEFLSAAGTTGAIPAQDLGPTLALWRLEDGGSKVLAEETGGLVLQTNDLVAGLERVADESRLTYLLGYEPTNAKRDGRYRKLKVEVLRPGLSVRARGGYFAAKGKEKPTPEPSVVQRVLRNPFDADGIPLRLAAYVMGPAPLQSLVPKTGVEVLIAGEVRLDGLETHLKNGRLVAEPTLSLVASSRSGESHESNWTLEIALGQPAPGAEAAKAWHPFLTRIAMSPGDLRARLVVESGGRVGSVTVDFDVPDFTEERLSTPILSDQLVGPEGLGAGGGGARRVMPVVRRSFPATSTLHGWIELHGAAREAETGQPKATASFAVRSADGREWASAAPVAMNLEDETPTRLVSIPLSEAPEGESELILTVRDEVSGRTVEAREPFRVERLPGSLASGDPARPAGRE
jgi:VWFA-related protein